MEYVIDVTIGKFMSQNFGVIRFDVVLKLVLVLIEDKFCCAIGSITHTVFQLTNLLNFESSLIQ